MVEWSLLVTAALPLFVVVVLIASVVRLVATADGPADAPGGGDGADPPTDLGGGEPTGTETAASWDDHDGTAGRSAGDAADGSTAADVPASYGGADRTEPEQATPEGTVSEAQRARDRAHERAQRRPAEEAAEVGETYELVVRETQYDRDPPEVRGTVNGLQTFVREVPDPDGPDPLGAGDVVRVQVVDYGTRRTSALARFLERA